MAQPNHSQPKKSQRERSIDAAKCKTELVHQELKLAAARLHLANTALEYTLPPGEKKGDVKKALEENAVVEQTVKESAKELAHVKELLEEERKE